MKIEFVSDVVCAWCAIGLNSLEQVSLRAYFTEGEDPSDRQVLISVASEVGLDPLTLKEIIESDRYAIDTRERERFYQARGIHSVPSIIFNDGHLIRGSQPVEESERAFRQLT